MFNNSSSGKPSSLGHHKGDKRSTPEEKAKPINRTHPENKKSVSGTEGSPAVVNSSVDNLNDGHSFVETNSKTAERGAASSNATRSPISQGQSTRCNSADKQNTPTHSKPQVYNTHQSAKGHETDSGLVSKSAMKEAENTDNANVKNTGYRSKKDSKDELPTKGNNNDTKTDQNKNSSKEGVNENTDASQYSKKPPRVPKEVYEPSTETMASINPQINAARSSVNETVLGATTPRAVSTKVEKKEDAPEEEANKDVSKDKADSTKMEKLEEHTEEAPNKGVSKDEDGDITASVRQGSKPAIEEKYKRIRFLSEDKAKARLKWCVDELKGLEEYDKGVTREIMQLISGMYFDYKAIRRELGDVLIKEGFVELTEKILKEFNRLGIFTNDTIWFPTYFIYNCWWNYSDANDTFAEVLAENGIVLLLTMNISHKPYLQAYSTSKNVLYVLKASISILHNIARVGTMKHHFDENKTSEALVPFLSQDDGLLKIVANLTIAHTQDDDTNKKQILGPETIECMVQWTEEALNSKSKRHRGFSPFELIDGLNKLAVNDNNKMTIVEKGAIPVLIKMMMGDDVTDQASATRMVWTLAFDKDVRQKLKDDTVLMCELEKLKSSQESRVDKNASGALWVIKGENDIANQKRPQTAATRGHIMLSYSWSDKKMVIKIKDQLKAAGYTVWIDIEKMGGSTLEAMAEAIEQASIVLLCMSEKYKNSPNCRTEAEYTFQLRKTYIPLMMQKKYKPDGWLGIILGVKLFFDFSGKYPFEKPFSGLVKELQTKQRTTQNETAHSANDATDGAVVATGAPKTFAQPGRRQSTLTSVKSSVLNMGQPEVTTWLQNEAELTACLNHFKKFRIDGKLLTQLMVMRTEAPEFFYQCLEKRLNMDLTEILQFTSALDELGT